MGFDGWWWWPNPFGPASPESAWITWVILGVLALGLIGAVPAAIFRVTIKNKLIDRRLRNPVYVEKNKGKFFHIDQNSGLVILRSGVCPLENSEWVLSDDLITITSARRKSTQTITFCQIDKVEIEPPQKHRKFGYAAKILIWRSDRIPTLQHKKADNSLGFKSIGMPAAEEIVRRFNEYAASRKNK